MGLRHAVVSSSANTRDVLVAVGIERFFEARIDGVVVGARALGVAPEQATVFENALAGVTAGRAASPASWASTAPGRPGRCANAARA